MEEHEFTMGMDTVNFPKMIRIRQRFDTPVVRDISREITSQVRELELWKKVERGESVAVACSSRGIANYSTIVKETVRLLTGLGLDPFLVPAMGSHGGATSEGQKRLLENYGITESAMGAPLLSSLEVTHLGETEDGVPVFIDSMAFKADHIVLINRIKSHTEFTHEFESGLLKMMAVGLGKEKGATLYHKAFMTYGYPRVILTVAHKIMETGKILFGIGVVENGYSQTAEIRVLAPEEIEEKEKALLKKAKRLSPGLPFDEVDVLIIDEMGKDISGSGFDTKVVGRIMMPLVAQEPDRPRVKRIVVCDLTAKTEGNADGVGIADFVTKRLVDKIDLEALYVNAMAGAEPEHARIPLTLENDREAIGAAIKTIGLVPPEKARIIRIRNTLELGEVEVSQAYESELSGRKDLEAITKVQSMVFDNDGNLEPFRFFT
ncbi:MAG: DUF2088 domain-containing protein [Deltaproteobacteria bacterium]|nr:DUF2088 domain-containing protein [Deltaproteobacteria bacterium]